MRRWSMWTIVLMAALSCVGCAGGLFGTKNGVELSAAPLEPFRSVSALEAQCILNVDVQGVPGTVVSKCDGFDKAHVLAYESQTKCSAFVTDLFARAASTNVDLDILTTFLTSAASVTTPTEAAHILSAGGAVASGTKLSIDNEYLNSLTISHIVQAIQQSYATDMADYIEQLDKLTDTERGKVSFFAEIPRIQAIHNECSLPAAEATIATTLQAGGGTPAAKPEAQTTYSVNYTVIGSETLENVAKGVAMALNGSNDLRLLSVIATLDSTDKKKIILSISDKKVSLGWAASVAPTSSSLKIQVSDDGKSLSISGKATDKDVVTIVATPKTKSDATGANGTSAAPPAANSTVTRPRGKVARAGERLQLKQ